MNKLREFFMAAGVLSLVLIFVSTGFAFDFQSRLEKRMSRKDVSPIENPYERKEGLFSKSEISEPQYVPDELLLKFKTGVARPEALKIIAQYNCHLEEYLTSLDIYKLKVSEKNLLSSIIRGLNQEAKVKFAEPNTIYKAYGVPEELKNKDYYKKIGLDKALAYIEALRKLGFNIGNIPVAIVDTGLIPHKDITNLLPGYDFVDDDNDPTDPPNGYGHGTHVAGIVTTISNGLAQIMPVRVLDAGGSGTEEAVAKGIRYAVEHGAKVINLSLGSAFPSKLIMEEIKNAVENGVLVVVAAGNGGFIFNDFPASYWDALSVAATDAQDLLTYFSTFNPAVDISAPGYEVLSTYYNDSYRYFSGTSMATPVVAGAAALLFAINPDFTPQEVRNILLKSVDNIEANNPEHGGLVGKGRINVYDAVKAAHLYTLLNKVYGTSEQIENLLAQLPEDNKLNEAVKNFLKESAGKSEYQGKEGKLKWLMEVWRLSDKSKAMAVVLATNLETAEPDKVAGLIKDYSIQDLIPVFELLNPKFAGRVLSKTSADFAAGVVKALNSHRQAVDILAHLFSMKPPEPIIYPSVKKAMEEMGITLGGVEDPDTSKIELSPEFIAELEKALKGTKLENVVALFKNKGELNAEKVVELISNLDTDIAAKVLEWLEPKLVKEVLAKLDPKKATDIFTQSSFLVTYYMLDDNYEFEPEFVEKIVTNANPQQLARIYTSGKMAGNDFLKLIGRRLSPEKAVSFLVEVNKLVKDNPQRSIFYLGYVFHYLFIETGLSRDKLSQITQALVNTEPNLGNIAQIYQLAIQDKPDIGAITEKISQLEDLKLANFILYSLRSVKLEPEGEFAKSKSLTAEILKKMDLDKLVAILAANPNIIGFISEDFSIKTEADKEWAKQLVAKLAMKIYQDKKDPWEKKAFVEGMGGMFLSILASLIIGDWVSITDLINAIMKEEGGEEFVKTMIKDSDRIDDLLTYTSQLFEHKGGELPTDLLEGFSDEKKKLLATYWNILTKGKNGEYLSDADIDGIIQFYKNFDVNTARYVLGATIPKDEKNMDVFLDALIRLKNKDLDIFKKIYAEEDIRRGLGLTFVLASLKTESQNKVMDIINSLGYKGIIYLAAAYQAIEGLWDEPDMDFYRDLLFKGMDEEVVQNRIEEIKKKLAELDPIKARIFEVYKMMTSKIQEPESPEEGFEKGPRFIPFTSEEILSLEKLFVDIGADAFLFLLKFVSLPDLLVDLFTKVKPEMKNQLLLQDEEFTLGLLSAVSPEEAARLVSDMKVEEVAKILQSVPPAIIAKIFTKLQEINTVLANSLYERLTKDNPRLKLNLDLGILIAEINKRKEVGSADIETLEKKYQEFKEAGRLAEFAGIFAETVDKKLALDILTGIDKDMAKDLTSRLDEEYLAGFFYREEKEDKEKKQKDKPGELDFNKKVELLTRMDNKKAVAVMKIFVGKIMGQGKKKEDTLFYKSSGQSEQEEPIFGPVKEPPKDNPGLQELKRMESALRAKDPLKADILKVVIAIGRNSAELEKEYGRDLIGYYMNLRSATQFPQVSIEEDEIEAIERIYQEAGLEVLAEVLSLKPNFKGGDIQVNPYALAEILLKVKNTAIIKDMLLKGEQFAWRLFFRDNSIDTRTASRIFARLGADDIAQVMETLLMQDDVDKDTAAQIIAQIYLENPQLLAQVIEKLKMKDSDFTGQIEKIVTIVKFFDGLNKAGTVTADDLNSAINLAKESQEAFAKLLTLDLKPNLAIDLLTQMPQDIAREVIAKIDNAYFISFFNPQDEEVWAIELSKKVKLFSLMGNKKTADVLFGIMKLAGKEGEKNGISLEDLEKEFTNLGGAKSDIFTLVKFITENSVLPGSISEDLTAQFKAKGDTGNNSRDASVEKRETVSRNSEMDKAWQEFLKRLGVGNGDSPVATSEEQKSGSVGTRFPPFEVSDEKLAEIAAAVERLYKEKEGDKLVVYILLAQGTQRKVNPEALVKLSMKFSSEMLKDLMLKHPEFSGYMINSEVAVKDIAKLLLRLDAETVAQVLAKVSDGGKDVSRAVLVAVELFRQDEAFAQEMVNKLKPINADLANKILLAKEFSQLITSLVEGKIKLEADTIKKLETYYDKLKTKIFGQILTSYGSAQTNVDILLNISEVKAKAILKDTAGLLESVIDSEASSDSVANLVIKLTEPPQVAEVFLKLIPKEMLGEKEKELDRLVNITLRLWSLDRDFTLKLLNALREKNPALANTLIDRAGLPIPHFSPGEVTPPSYSPPRRDDNPKWPIRIPETPGTRRNNWGFGSNFIW